MLLLSSIVVCHRYHHHDISYNWAENALLRMIDDVVLQRKVQKILVITDVVTYCCCLLHTMPAAKGEKCFDWIEIMHGTEEEQYQYGHYQPYHSVTDPTTPLRALLCVACPAFFIGVINIDALVFMLNQATEVKRRR